MPRDPLSDPKAFRHALNTWFRNNGRDYPWRRTTDPYAILVSEVMLQQTRIATVLDRGYYTRFLERFPDPACLAAAGDDELLRAWEGLGYYRRARMLREAARAVVEHHGGRFPSNHDALLALPGIGPYTAAALLSFAFDQPAALVDGNVARVLARLFDFRLPVDSGAGPRRIRDWAGALVDPELPRIFNSALMELGQTHCSPARPDCGPCPVRRFCSTEDPASLPLRKPRPKPTEVTEHAIFARRPDGSVLLQRSSNGRRDGFWQLPLRKAAEVAIFPHLTTTRYPITRYRVTLHTHAGPADSSAGPDEQWHPAESLGDIPVAAPFRRVLKSLLAD